MSSDVDLRLTASRGGHCNRQAIGDRGGGEKLLVTGYLASRSRLNVWWLLVRRATSVIDVFHDYLIFPLLSLFYFFVYFSASSSLPFIGRSFSTDGSCLFFSTETRDETRDEHHQRVYQGGPSSQLNDSPLDND